MISVGLSSVSIININHPSGSLPTVTVPQKPKALPTINLVKVACEIRWEYTCVDGKKHTPPTWNDLHINYRLCAPCRCIFEHVFTTIHIPAEARPGHVRVHMNYSPGYSQLFIRLTHFAPFVLHNNMRLVYLRRTTFGTFTVAFDIPRSLLSSAAA